MCFVAEGKSRSSREQVMVSQEACHLISDAERVIYATYPQKAQNIESNISVYKRY